MISDAQFTAWLKDHTAIRCVLVEVSVKLAGGSIVTRYLSNKVYVTAPTDTPANTAYSARITGGINYTRSMSLDGSATLSFGDIELNNKDGALDSWVDDYWANRSFSIYLGDSSWPRADFRQIFSGVTTGIDMRKRDTLNITISDVMQRLNNPVTEAKLGGTSSRADDVLPLCFGECHNITPVLTDGTINEYMVHNGPIENIIEVRDNGVPVSFTQFPATGKFRLAASPAGTITASVQGAKLAANILYAESDFGGWTNSGVSGIMNVIGAPTQTAQSLAIVPSTAVTEKYSTSGLTASAVPAGTNVTVSAYVAGGASRFQLVRAYAEDGTSFAEVKVNTVTGAVTSSVSSAFTTNGGVLLSAKAVRGPANWWRVWVTFTSVNTASKLRVRFQSYSDADAASWAGDGSAASGHVSGVQIEQAAQPTQYLPSFSSGSQTYKNSVAAIVKALVTQYGHATNRFTDGDLDLDAFAEFDSLHTQQVGIYLPSRQNVLEVVNKLTASVGARLVPDGTGKCSLVKLTLPQASAGTAVGSKDMVQNSLDIKQLVPVVASVKIGYAKNWTVQSSLTTGVVSEHLALYADEWLTVTRTDTAAADNYNLFTDPTMVETYLLSAAEAIEETNRRLNIFNVQRKIVRYRSYYHLIREKLGASQTITHPRFGLSAGKTGQIVSISVDLTSPYVNFEVLI